MKGKKGSVVRHTSMGFKLASTAILATKPNVLNNWTFIHLKQAEKKAMWIYKSVILPLYLYSVTGGSLMCSLWLVDGQVAGRFMSQGAFMSVLPSDEYT